MPIQPSLREIDKLADAARVNRPQEPQRHHREEVRLAHDHQGEAGKDGVITVEDAHSDIVPGRSAAKEA